MTHSAVVSRSEMPLPLWTREKGGRRERPPPNRGGMRSSTDGVCTRLCTGPHGVAHVSFIPAGRLAKTPLSPLPWMISNRSSPSRVRFAASRPGLLRADPKNALLTRGKGGGADQTVFVSHLIAFDSTAPRPKAEHSGRVDGPKGNLSGIPDALSRSRGALSPAGP